MRFCSGCGERLDGAPPVTCSRCGRSHWSNAKPAAGGLVTLGDKLLLVRRANEPWAGSWCAPAGFCDGDEHPILTAEREIVEESGIHVRVVGFLGIWTDDYGPPAAGSPRESISVAYYHAVPLEAESRPPDPEEVSEVRWFSWDELPADLAPPRSFPPVLAAWRSAFIAGTTVTPLPDRP